MPTSSVVKNIADGSCLLKDGTGTPLQLLIDFEDGNVSISGLKKKLRETVAYQSRGVLKSVRHTGRTFPTGSFSAMMTHFTSATATSLADIILANGYFASAVSTLGANADVYTLDMTFTEEGTAHGDAADHSFTLEDCELQLDFADGDPAKFSVSFTCYGAITGDLAI